MNSLLLDISVVMIFCIFIILGFRSGVIKSFLSFAGYIFSSLSSVYCADISSKFVYFNFIEPEILKKVENQIVSKTFNLDKLLNSIPKPILEFLPKNGITPSTISHIINNNTVSVSAQKIVNSFSPIIIDILKSSFTAVLFIAFVMLTKWISKLIFRICKFSPIKHTNTILGGIFGLFKGYISILVCMCCLRAIITIKQDVDVSQIFSEESISNTMIFNKMYENNPIYNFFIGVSN
ncbi:MAG: CvpA family protein [Clostridia bacterium]|nr:CvpA family protein [Clostridia bacterium]